MSLLKRVSVFSIGEVGSRIPLIIVEILLARYMGVVTFGQWSLLRTLVTYGNYSHLGVASSFLRREPVYIDTENLIDRDADLQSLACFQLITCCFLYLSLEVICYLFEPTSIFFVSFWSRLCLFLVLFSQQCSLVFQGSAINFGFLRLLSTSRIAFSLSFMISVILVVKLDLPSHFVLYAWLISILVSIFILLLANIFRAIKKVKISKERIQNLLQDGFPIIVLSVGRTLLGTLDRLLIFLLASGVIAGYYGVGAVASSIVGLACGVAVRIQTPPFLVACHRRKGVSAIVSRQLGISMLTLCLLLTLFPFIPALLIFFLPDFYDAYKIIGCLGLAGGIFSLATGFSEFLIVSGGKKKALLIIYSHAVFALVTQGLSWYIYENAELNAALSVLVATSCSYLCLHQLGTNFFDHEKFKILMRHFGFYLFVICGLVVFVAFGWFVYLESDHYWYLFLVVDTFLFFFFLSRLLSEFGRSYD
jgi:O-antigen/teichoic acid export membrane protein